ncbi:hypothetical protein BDQ17DRAFT_1334466 [Cyathus striatus]|nr:hypothetical protein BDQ17DRAFT_1334466 [Cyathus striatus]
MSSGVCDNCSKEYKLPVLVLTCGHKFCQRCIEERKSECITCQTQSEEIATNRNARSNMRVAALSCIHLKRGTVSRRPDIYQTHSVDSVDVTWTIYNTYGIVGGSCPVKKPSRENEHGRMLAQAAQLTLINGNLGW